MTPPVALMYHDVTSGDLSGFETPGADGYKVSISTFDRHLEIIARQAPIPPGIDLERPGLRLTFDDGGASAYSVIADRLEKRGWRGFFFVTTSRIDTVGFLSKGEIRDLDERGHCIGSHSARHPLEMARLRSDQISAEWLDSCAVLEEILGRPIEVASVPGGMYSREVAKEACRAGIRHLFTSEPTATPWSVDACRVYGRYAIKNNTTTAWVGSVAAGDRTPRWRQKASWEARKAAKRVLGPWYSRLRNRLQ